MRAGAGEIVLNLVFSQVLVQLYQSSSNTVSVLEAYLSVFATGQFQGPQGKISFDVSNFDQANAQENSSVRPALQPCIADRPNSTANVCEVQVLEVLRLFGADTIWIWAAVLLKKRVLVVADQPATLLAIMRVGTAHCQEARTRALGSTESLLESGSSGTGAARVRHCCGWVLGFRRGDCAGLGRAR